MLWFLGLISLNTIGQTNSGSIVSVSGVVTSSADNKPLPFVSVVIKGTTRGTSTDQQGRYTLNLSGSDQTLVFSFVGMTTREVLVEGRSVINVVLDPVPEQLREVVVIGYGSESRALLTGSVGLVGEAQIRNIPVGTIDGVLQGKAAGVQVIQNSGAPGAAISVRVRGTSSIGAGNEPLYVVDGIPVITGDYGQIGFSGQGINALSDLNPADIESISILRDASAAAIYGARASNGVVLITTKRGKAQKTRFTFSSYLGTQDVPKPLELLNASQFMEYVNERSLNEGGLPIYTQEEIDHPAYDTDWLSHVLRRAPISSYELSAAGGTDQTRFYLSGTVFDQAGTLIGTDYRKLTARANIDHRVSQKLLIGMGFSTSYSLNNRKEGDQSLNSPLVNAISLSPLYPVYNSDGSFNEDGAFANPVSIGEQQINESFNYRNLGNVFADYEIIPGLKLNTKWGFDYLNLREHSYDPPTTRQGAKYKGLGYEASAEVVNIVSNNTLSYSGTFNKKHHLNALAGYSFEKYRRRSMLIRGQDFPNENLQYIASAATIVEARASGLDRGMNSWFGQVRYHYDYRYLATLSARYDGSSKFGANNRYGFFPAASFAWRVSEEQFFTWKRRISDLKIRAGYGMTGNDGIPDFSASGLYSGGSNYLGNSGIYPSQLPNPDLRWESTAQLNAGIDLGLYKDRIKLTADVYHKMTRDLLLDMPIPGSSGFTYITRNIGEMENKGLEVNLITQNTTGLLAWTSNLNFSMNRNKVTKLYNDQPIDNIGRGGNRIEVGQPIGVFFNWKALGVDPTTGDIIFEDVNGDGLITTEDRTIIGNPHPKFIGGLGNEFSYKRFHLNVFIQGSYGNDIFNGTRRYIETMKSEDNQSIAVLDRWRNPGDITTIPRATLSDPNGNDRMSSRFIEDGSYLRLKDLRLAYEVNTSQWTPHPLRFRVYIAAQNLLTLTGYSGMDPEVNYAGQDNLRLGTDFFTYPHARVFMFGVNVDF